MKKITEFHLVGRLNIFMDELYDECVTANSLTEHQEWVSRGTAERWMAVLQAADLPNILAAVSFVLSIPFSTGFSFQWKVNEQMCRTNVVLHSWRVSWRSLWSFTVQLDRKNIYCCKRSKKCKWKKGGIVQIQSFLWCPPAQFFVLSQWLWNSYIYIQ